MTKFEEDLIEQNREIVHLLRNILKRLSYDTPNQFTLRLEFAMALGNITAGSTGTFEATLLLNGQPYAVPAGSTYEFAPTFTASDPDVTLATSGAESVASVPATSTDTSLTVDASATAPDGTALTASPVTVTITPEPQVFTLGLAQTA